MALRNTLLVCAAIVGGGAVAGTAMKSQSSYGPGYVSGSSDFSTPSAPGSYDAATPTYGTDSQTATDSQTVAVMQMERPDRLLLRMPVENSSGQRLGEVARVSMDSSGHAQEIVLNEGTRIGADGLVYVPARSVLVTQVAPDTQNQYGAPNAPGGYAPPNTYGQPNPPAPGYGRPNGYGSPNGYGPPNAPANGYGPPNEYGPPNAPANGYGQPNGYGPPNGAPNQYPGAQPPPPPPRY